MTIPSAIYSDLQPNVLGLAPASTSTSYDEPQASALPMQDAVESESVGGQVGSVTRHETYYIPSGDVVFQVENTLFRVHRYFFERESAPFRDMLSLPMPGGQNSNTGSDKGKSPSRQPEGTTDESPINLPQVTSDDFASLLWVFYNPTYYQYNQPIETWASILHLAHRWDFPSIRALAFHELEGAPPAARLVLGEKYEAPTDWRMRAMMELVTRKKPLTASEGEELGSTLVVQIAEMRENMRGGKDTLYGRRMDYFHDRRRSYSPRRSRTPSPHPVIIQPPIPVQPPPPHFLIPPSPGPTPIIIPGPVHIGTLSIPSSSSLHIPSMYGQYNDGRKKWRSRAKDMFRRLSRISFLHKG